ncbi:hypothetical protein [Peribacillus simplex]|uniref:hypothetical protein n=1 Tax=Peribacillus simplex TaxID=1478 RepID=UPI0016265F61|nr:hypothetical protein [Peribacillus simplex]
MTVIVIVIVTVTIIIIIITMTVVVVEEGIVAIYSVSAVSVAVFNRNFGGCHNDC